MPKKEGKIDCFILAGGLGTRLAPIIGNDLKCMTRICGAPLLSIQIKQLRESPLIGNIFVTIPADRKGTLKKKLYKKYNVTFIEEEEREGTAGAIKKYYNLSQTDDILVVYGDILFSMDVTRLIKYHQSHDHSTTIAIRPTDHPLDSDLVDFDKDYNITNFIRRPMDGEREGQHSPDAFLPNTSNVGIFIINHQVVDKINIGDDFSRDIWNKVSFKKAYYTTEYFKDIGTVTRYREASFDYRNGLVRKRSLMRPRPAFFLDRDGVINSLINNLADWKDFHWLPGVMHAIQTINKHGYLAILVTNQPVVAKGIASIADIEEIHRRMQWEMAVYGCYFDKVYYCPHHPDAGFPEENKEYKIDCNCRKPKIGMFEQACQDFNIDIERSLMVGDTQRDADFAHNCGLRFFLDKNKNLYHFVSKII